MPRGPVPGELRNNLGKKRASDSSAFQQLALYTVSGARAPCTLSFQPCLARERFRARRILDSNESCLKSWRPDVAARRQRPREPSSAHCCVPSGLHPTMFSYYASLPECLRHASSIIPLPPSSIRPPLRSGFHEVLPRSFRRSPIPWQHPATRATRASANRNWPGTCLREKLLCLPTRTGLKAVKDSASASPEENLKGTTKRDTRLGSSTFLRSPFVVSVLPSFPRIVSLRTAVLLPPPRFFRLPTFAPIPPTSSTLRVTNESPRGLRIDDPLGLDSGRGNR